MISVVRLGTVSYADSLRLQQKLVNLRKAGQIPDLLLLLEHPPVITLGRNAKAANILAPTEHLAARGVEVFDCDRGGDVTFHGPGQLVGYPIFDLRGFSRQPSNFDSNPHANSASSHPERQSAIRGADRAAESKDPYSELAAWGHDEKLASLPPDRKTLGAVDYVRRLEDVLIRTCADFKIPTNRLPGLTGVWTAIDPAAGTTHEEISREMTGRRPKDLMKGKSAESGSTEKKIAAIGVHISRSVTSHGFALNINTDLSYFNLIVPCGITVKPVTSMQKELGHEVDIDRVAQSLARNFGTVFSRQILWVETIDALLGHAVGVPMKPPSEIKNLHGGDDPLFA